MKYIICTNCGKRVSSHPVPKETVIRAWIECPECTERNGLTWKTPKAEKGQ